MLEDNYKDIISKASMGLNKKINSNDIEEAAKELNLNFRALKNIKDGKYKPKKFDYFKTYNGLRVVKISSPFMDGEVNAYIVIDKDKNCTIIDTAQAAEKIIGLVKKEKLIVKAILKTHEHHDHVEGIEKIEKEFDIEVGNIENFRDIKFFKTPGHSKESLTYQIGKFLFAGDLIFACSLGGGSYSYEKLLESAKRILSLDEDLFIFPGHGSSTTVKEERENNAFFE